MTPERRAAIEKACGGGDMLFPEVGRELLAALDATELRAEGLLAEVKHLRAVDTAARAELERMQRERDELRKAIRDKAERQESFAGPEYTQHDESSRKMFLHAAKMLRDLLPKEGTTDAGNQ